MYTLKTITLTLMLIIFSIVGLRAEEISLQDLLNEGKQAYGTADYPTALKKWEQGLNLARQAKHQQAIGVFLGNIGLVYDNLGSYPKALEYFQQALAILKEIGDKRGEGADLSNIGNVHQNLGSYPKALEYYQQALKIKKEIGDKRGEGADLTNIGVVYDNLGTYPIALDYYQKALKIRKEIGDKRGEGADLSNIGVVYDNLGQYQTALESFQESIFILETIGADSLWQAQRGLASTEAKLNQSEPAIQHYEQALDNLEKLRAGITEKEHKLSFMRDKLFVYDALIVLLQSLHPNHPKKGYDRKAIEIFERKQGRVFLE